MKTALLPQPKHPPVGAGRDCQEVSGTGDNPHCENCGPSSPKRPASCCLVASPPSERHVSNANPRYASRGLSARIGAFARSSTSTACSRKCWHSEKNYTQCYRTQRSSRKTMGPHLPRSGARRSPILLDDLEASARPHQRAMASSRRRACGKSCAAYMVPAIASPQQVIWDEHPPPCLERVRRPCAKVTGWNPHSGGMSRSSQGSHKASTNMALLPCCPRLHCVPRGWDGCALSSCAPLQGIRPPYCDLASPIAMAAGHCCEW
mmetsp:Transcript_40565/g.88666  ORF Transcript_40565/g.88666 Transcript_40565/m.88666 type:complete len:263 (-) Transcript_40565:68-856(-)